MVEKNSKNKEILLQKIIEILKDYNQIELEIIVQILRFLKNLEKKAQSKE
jgi:uncharacterized protein (DUF433 family)